MLADIDCAANMAIAVKRDWAKKLFDQCRKALTMLQNMVTTL